MKNNKNNKEVEKDDLNEEETIDTVGMKAIHYNNLVDRYFEKYYIDKNTDKEQYIFIHTNGYI